MFGHFTTLCMKGLKRQKIRGFLTISGSLEMEHCLEMGLKKLHHISLVTPWTNIHQFSLLRENFKLHLNLNMVLCGIFYYLF